MAPEIWTLEKVKNGFEKFYELYDRYPTAYDVDDFDFLPSSRQIQRKFGGLVNLRKNLGLKVENYNQGEERSANVAKFNKRGRQYEVVVYKLLKNYFDDKFIHIERPTLKDKDSYEYDSKDRYDFYVYAKPNNFAIDVFGTKDERGLTKILNIKEKKYRKIISSENLYFIYFGDNVNRKKVDSWLTNKRNRLPENWYILDLDDFKKEVINYTSYKAV